MCLLLMLARRYYHYASQLQFNGNYAGFSDLNHARRLHGLRCGIIGLGRIGTCFAMRAKAFGLRVCFYDPYVGHGVDKALDLHQYEQLDSLLKECDVISVHCLLSDETYHMLNKQNLKLVKPGAFLINTARGSIVGS